MSECFSDEVIEPVQVVDSRHAERKLSCQSCVSSTDLKVALESTDYDNIHVRFISICQRNSWRPLQITHEMFQAIACQHGLNESVHELSSCFYTRNLDLEEMFCVPLSVVRSGNFLDISYTLRYPEFKSKEDQWTLRQSGIYHRLNEKTGQQLVLLLSPLPDSAAHVNVVSRLQDAHGLVFGDPLWIHGLVFSSYIPAWRGYMAWLESRLIPISNLTFVAEIDQEMRIKYEELNTLYVLINKLLQIPTLISHSLAVLDNLICYAKNPTGLSGPAIQELENLRHKASAYSRTADCLHKRAQTTAQLLSDTLSLREQTVAKNQAENMASVSKSAHRIAIMGLLYLPVTLVATIFGTNFFDFDPQTSAIALSPNIWYFFVSSGLLTLITLFTCYRFRWNWLVVQMNARLAKSLGIMKRWEGIRTRKKGGMNGSLV